MSLFSTLQIASNSLISTQVGLQVIGNNIANANTPGYTRQEVVYTPAPTQLIGTQPLGLGVQIRGIIQQADQFLDERLRGAISDVENTESQKQTFLQLEAIIGELSENDLSTSMNRFFAAVNDVLNQPEDLGIRNVAALQGDRLAKDISRLDSRIRQIRRDVNDKISSTANDINRLTDAVAKLNVQIVAAESGSGGSSQAGGLRDQRRLALQELSQIIGIRVVEQESGAATVFAEGDYLVVDGTTRAVGVEYTEDRGIPSASINILDSDSPISTATGRLTGLYTARDAVLGGALDQLDDFARTFAFEFNKVFSSGQGLSGYNRLESERGVGDATAALDAAGLDFTPVNGSFEVLVRNKRTGSTQTTEVRVDLNGLDEDTTFQDLVSQLEAVSGISASMNFEGGLVLTADSEVLEFSFANDTSGVLAALGVNTFFSGTTANSLGVSTTVRNDPSKFAASQGGIGADTENAVALAGLATERLTATGGLSLFEVYERFTGDIFQASAATQAVNDGFRSFQATLEGQQLGISGVNIDEQAVKMIQHQRAFQASARLVSTLSEMMDVLVNL